MAAQIKGQLGALNLLGDAVLRDIYTVDPLRVADVNVTIINRADTATNIRLAHIKNGAAGAVTTKDYLLFDLSTAKLASNFAPISYTSILMAAGDTIAAYSSVSDLSIQINGIEEDA